MLSTARSWPSCIDAPATVGTRPVTKHAISIANARRIFMSGFLLSLEPDVLQCFCGPAVVPRGHPVLPPASREIPAGDPHGRAMARRLGLLGRSVCFGEPFVSFVKSILFHERATKHQLRHRDLTGVVGAVVEKLESLAREALRVGVLL